MSIKDLFNKRNYTQISKATPIESASVSAESTTMIEAKRKEIDKFVPPIDFSTASNYAKFGSAELYFENGFKRIYEQYPYDGTLAEKLEFENSSSYLDKYIFDNLYPRTNGYAVFSVQGAQHSALAAGDWARPVVQEYIYVQGGPHTASGGMIGKPYSETFDKSMIYDVTSGSKKGSSFETNMVSGSTIEFWMKKGTFLRTNHRQVLFDLWNGVRFQDNDGDYGRMTLYLTRSTNAGDPSFALTLKSGSRGFDTLTLGSTQASSSIVDNAWHHYAVTIQSASQSSLKIELYIDGDLDYVTGSNRNYITEIPIKSNGLVANIGALVTSSLENESTRLGDGKLSASIDDFRFWKVARTSEQIHNTWNIPIGGGTNKHDSNKDLGAYFKFNEGVTATASTDSVVLDYSGRIANGVWTGYASGSRRTTSAFVESGKVAREFKDPIIYSYHPDVTASIRQYRASGSLADRSKTSMFYNLFPAWMQETDTENGKQLKYLSQIIGSYFDTLWHQIQYLNRLKDKEYVTGSSKPLPFAKKLLESRGFMMPDLFIDASLSETFLKKNESHVFEKDLSEIKNTIYQNIYNNLDCIYKSKGAEKSFRNFFRSVGINSELVKLKMYADDSTYVLRENLRNVSYEKNFINFNTENNMTATVFQTSSSLGKENSFIHSSSAEFNRAFTLETEVVLPLKESVSSDNHVTTNFLTSSIVGFTKADADPDVFAFISGSRDIHIIVARDKYDGELQQGGLQTVRFGISSSHNSVGVQYGPRVKSQYNDNKWNLALSFKDEKYPYGSFIAGNSVTPENYIVTLYGVETEGTIIKNSFSFDFRTDQSQFVTDRKRVYAGAYRTAFTGTVIHQSDVKLGNVRYWRSFLPTSSVIQHAFDPESYGTMNLYRPDILLNNSASVPVAETLVLHWGFNTLTGSDSEGKIRIPDLSSGSYTDSSLSSSFGQDITRMLKSMHIGKGYGFLASSTSSISKEYLYAAKKSQPDDLYSSDLVTIQNESSENFFTDEDVSDNFYSFEKSLYGTISQEMLNMFSNVKDFANLIGQPNQKYHSEYHKLNQLKNIFFEDVENDPDIEKFTRFYKWIDDSISKAIEQLIPASARFSNSINNMVESHVLERNKYVHKVGLLTRRESTEGSIKGVSELLYDWESGHAPVIGQNQRLNCLWWSDRADTTETGRHSSSINTIRDVINNHSLQSSGLSRRKNDGTAYYGSTYAIRKLSKPYNFEAVQKKTLHGGINYGQKVNKFLFLDAVSIFGTQDSVPNNVITVGVGNGVTGISNKQLCDIKLKETDKIKFGIEAENGKYTNDYLKNIKGNLYFPFNFVSGTVHNGYNSETKRNYRSDVVITNLHSDIVDISNDVPMQGPFTETHVGGHQSRHVAVNKHDTNKLLKVYSLTTSGQPAVGQISITGSAISFGDIITIEDADGTSIVAKHQNYFDLLNNFWSSAVELKDIIENKLDITVSLTTAGSNNQLDLTMLEIGTAGNSVPILVSGSTSGSIKKINFHSGVDATGSWVNKNLDEVSSRPEAFAIVMKEHPVINETDGAFGVVGADYGSNYPNYDRPRATRYRDEHAKRPLNIRNILFDSSSTSVGNYRKGYEIVTLQRADQKRWYRDARDANLHLPSHFITDLPDTSNYLTLVSQAPWNNGNYFGSGSNRTPDKTSEIVDDKSIGASFTATFNVTGNSNPVTYTVGYLRIDRNLTSPYDVYSFKFATGVTNGNTTVNTPGPGVGSQITIDVLTVANNWDATKGNFMDAVNNSSIFTAVTDDVTASAPITISEANSLGATANGGTISTTSAMFAAFGQTFSGGVTDIVKLSANDSVITIPRTDLTSSTYEIVNRFSAPGGPEINTIGYLDVVANSFSVYNSMPFRNLTVLHDSGEENKIRVVDHLNKRRGLRSLLAVHQGRGGLDSEFLTVLTASNYGISGSYVKQHRNTFKVPQYSGESVITGSRHDNGYLSSILPRSEFQYSWINKSTKGFRNVFTGSVLHLSSSSAVARQRIIGFAPESGIVSVRASASQGAGTVLYEDYPIEAIFFPSGSKIFSKQ